MGIEGGLINKTSESFAEVSLPPSPPVWLNGSFNTSRQKQIPSCKPLPQSHLQIRHRPLTLPVAPAAKIRVVAIHKQTPSARRVNLEGEFILSKFK